ncbi:tetratricopeptide repeat protein [Gymnodinialimonas ceratoperidinii]|uniref:Tetratricopeptide repeat protein n=1 Tax=Gymnodinialimonas ceratoperidinii TaxID=2856823 RepID=A0A8F6TU09_9RHOB|nr:tetratricopeptide repeat protein [Gymnodinialimonas ceratoperidinii]QXT38937.1 tetratricopeptide repeat protein [Gymnodinialimonas ceratoperidinii]
MSSGLHKIHVLGAFRLESPTGAVVAVKAKRARAILAALATGRDLARPRAWLQDLLWSERPKAQSGLSMRQCLHALRRDLGESRDILTTDKDVIALDAAKVWVDVRDDDHLAGLGDAAGELPQFLDGLTIEDPAFQRWLDDRRCHYGRRLAPPLPPEKSPVARPIIIRGRPDGMISAQTYDTVLQDLICKSIDDAGRVRLLDESAMPLLSRREAERAFRVQVSSADIGGSRGVSVNLSRSSDGSVFTNLVRVSDDIDMIDLVNEAVVKSMEEIARYGTDLPNHKIATALSVRALLSVTNYAPSTIENADALIARAFEIDPQPVFLAWRAYLRTFLLGEAVGGNAEAIREEMERFIRLAEEQDPDNSIVLSLAAFIHSMWFLSNENALELAQRSHKLNPSNPYGISYLGMVQTHLGNYEEGYRLTRRANSLTVHRNAKSSIRYVAMRSAACAGRYTEAIKIGEALGRDAPGFVAPKRLMGMLYMKVGRVDEAEAMVETLKQHEPDYSVEKMRDAFRASPLLHRSALGSSI